MNKNTEYEIFTQNIYQSLLNAEGKNTIVAKQNQKIKGKSGQSHQIDVYWEYEIAGIKHKVAIECKNYNTTISIGKVRDFNSVLVDIGNIVGIIVTKIGFQKGSLDFANHYGINLKILKEPEFEDWQNFGELMLLHMDINVHVKVLKSKTVKIDKEWVRSYYDNEDIKERILSGIKVNRNSSVVDSKGVFIKTLAELEQEMPKPTSDPNEMTIRKDFPDTYIMIENNLVKILCLEFELELKPHSQRIVNPIIKNTIGVLKDPNTGDKKFIEKDGTVK